MRSFSIKSKFILQVSFFLYFLFHLNSCSNTPHPIAAQQPTYAIPDTADIPKDKTGEAIRYGRQLFENTAFYLGPEGTVSKLCGNKMNCKNCHLDVGTRPYSNNLLETYLKYPQYRSREGMVLTIEDRINNCFERPMNGKMLAHDSKEMRAMVSYIRWLCEGKKVGYNEDSIHLGQISLIDRAADPKKGELIYKAKCAKCHGTNGEGQMTADKKTYLYPPLWGAESYAQGSSMHRLITASRFVKWSMPYTDTLTAPQLTDEEVFDVVSFINWDSIHPRPYRPLEKDCPDLQNKPIDFPWGPFLDTFSVQQHKLGPFKPIKEFYDKQKKK